MAKKLKNSKRANFGLFCPQHGDHSRHSEKTKIFKLGFASDCQGKIKHSRSQHTICTNVPHTQVVLFFRCQPTEMNYGDPAQQQQQQYYVQRMPQQTQRMAFPSQQQQIQTSSAGMISQQQQPRQAMVYPSPHQQQQTMMRMPQHMYTQGMGAQQQRQQQQQQQFKNLLQNLPQNVQAQINAERDPERKTQLFHNAIQRQHQMYEQQQQQHMAMMGTGTNQPGSVGMRPMTVQRMPMVQTTNGGPILFATTTTAQQSMSQQSVQTGTPVQFQRIPSQSSFVSHSSSPTPTGANYQPRPASSGHPSQMFMGNQHMTPAGAVQLRAPMPVSHPQFVQQHQQMGQSQQQFHRQFEPVPHMMSQSKQTDNLIITTVSQYQTSPAESVSAASQSRMAPLTVVKTENAATSAAPSVTGSVRSVPGDVASFAESHPASVGAYGMGRPGSVQQQQSQQQLCTYHADVKRLLGRFELDTPSAMDLKIKPSLINLIQVMEGTPKGGPVKKDTLPKLLRNVQTVLERYHISRNLFNVAKKLTTLAQNGTTTVRGTAPGTNEPVETDPWRNVRHLTITVPDSVLAILEEEKGAEQRREWSTGEGLRDKEKPTLLIGRKRRHQHEDEEGTAAAGEGSPAKKSLLERVAESFEPANVEKEKIELAAATGNGTRKCANDGAEELFRINCLDGTELVLSRAVSDALSKAVGMGFEVKTDAPDIDPPISRNAPSVQVRFVHLSCAGLPGREGGTATEADELAHKQSLDVLVPVDFPYSPLEQFYPHSPDPSLKMESFLERIDSGAVDMYSLDAVLSEWANSSNNPLTDEMSESDEGN
uniref:Mediator complex subunit 15 n=1 Tax=Globodera rostochiensis TaxID=31243 RepID=A0A914HUZ7_GLORO